MSAADWLSTGSRAITASLPDAAIVRALEQNSASSMTDRSVLKIATSGYASATSRSPPSASPEERTSNRACRSASARRSRVAGSGSTRRTRVMPRV